MNRNRTEIEFVVEFRCETKRNYTWQHSRRENASLVAPYFSVWNLGPDVWKTNKKSLMMFLPLASHRVASLWHRSKGDLFFLEVIDLPKLLCWFWLSFRYSFFALHSSLCVFHFYRQGKMRRDFSLCKFALFFSSRFGQSALDLVVYYWHSIFISRTLESAPTR